MLLLTSLSALMSSAAFAQSAIVDSIKNGKVNGNVRAHNVFIDKDMGADQQGFALGGKLHAENAALYGFNVGVTFNVASDFNLVSKQNYKRATLYKDYANLGEQDAVGLGESYLNYNGYNFNFRTGAQEFTSPFANPSDAFIMPISYTGHVLTYTGVEKLKLTVAQLNKVKFRNSDTFKPIGEAAVAGSVTDGLVVFGADYNNEQIKASAYHYGFDELMKLNYVTTGYTFNLAEGFLLTPSVQYATEKKTGKALRGDIDSSALGFNVNATKDAFKVDLSYVSIGEEKGKYLNGGFYSPLTFFTDALYTNSMVNGMAGIDAGSSYKLNVNYTYSESLSGKVSYADYDFKTNVLDRSEVNFDVTYKFSDIPGLSYTNRLAKVNSDTKTLAQYQWRAQLQLSF